MFCNDWITCKKLLGRIYATTGTNAMILPPSLSGMAFQHAWRPSKQCLFIQPVGSLCPTHIRQWENKSVDWRFIKLSLKYQTYENVKNILIFITVVSLYLYFIHHLRNQIARHNYSVWEKSRKNIIRSAASADWIWVLEDDQKILHFWDPVMFHLLLISFMSNCTKQWGVHESLLTLDSHQNNIRIKVPSLWQNEQMCDLNIYIYSILCTPPIKHLRTLEWMFLNVLKCFDRKMYT